MIAQFVVYGVPEPKGSMTAIVRGKRAVLVPGLNRKRKDGTRSDGRQRFQRWTAAVQNSALAWRLTHGNRTIDAPVSVEVWFFLPRAKSAPKRVFAPATKPDVDKLARAVLDPLVKAQVLAEDSRVVDLLVHKRFAVNDHPCAVIRVMEIAEASQLEPLRVEVAA